MTTDAKQEPKATTGPAFQFHPTEGQISPPLQGLQEAKVSEVAPEEIEEADKGRAGKVPVHPILVKMPLQAIGGLAAEITGFAGYEYTQEEQDGISELFAACDLEMNPKLQLVAGLVVITSLKVIAHIAWIRAGKPDMRDREHQNPKVNTEVKS